jgi:hypothetical protein
LPVPGLLLGWTSPTTVLVLVPSSEVAVIDEVDIWTGTTKQVSMIHHETGLGRSFCLPFEIQLATGLLPGLTTRAADPDRGPVLAAPDIALPLQAGLVATWAMWFWLRPKPYRWERRWFAVPSRFRRSGPAA